VVANCTCIQHSQRGYFADGDQCKCYGGYTGPECLISIPSGELRNFVCEIEIAYDPKHMANCFDLEGCPAFINNVSTFFSAQTSQVTLMTPHNLQSSRSAHVLSSQKISASVILMDDFELARSQLSGRREAFGRYLALNGFDTVILGFKFTCGQGFEPDQSVCKACDVGTFKSLLDNSSCIQCTKFSSTMDAGSTSELNCSCNTGYVEEPIPSDMIDALNRGEISFICTPPTISEEVITTISSVIGVGAAVGVGVSISASVVGALLDGTVTAGSYQGTMNMIVQVSSAVVVYFCLFA
jgi:hypothetical protein